MNEQHVTVAHDDTYVVQPHEIEGVLQALWRDSAGEDQEAVVMHVRTLNLLVFLPAAAATASVLDAIENVSIRHPGRTVTMIVSDDSEPPQGQVSIACRVGDGGKQVCGELITITCGDGGAPLPSIASSLLVAGVPSFLYWFGDPPWRTELFDSFAESVDHVIVDSRTWDRPFDTLRNLHQAILSHDPPIAYTDTQWTALTPWRQLTSQCFDLPDALPQLARLERLTIKHGARSRDRIAALLFVGWLASRLGWTVIEVRDDRLTLQSNGSSIAVALQRGTENTPLLSVTLESADAQFRLEHIGASNCVNTEIRLPDSAPIERMARLRPQPLEQLVGEELMMLEHDPGFEAALRVAAQLTH